MKKKFVILSMFILMLLISIPSAMAACSHSYRWITTRYATCTTTGIRSLKCSKCGHVKQTQTIRANGHDLYTAPGFVPPNCKRGSIKTTKCRKCSYSKDETLPPDPNHHSAMSYVWVNHERCETPGKKEYKCGNCGYVDKSKDMVVNPTGHDYVDDAYQLIYDCDETKYKTQTCPHSLCEKPHRTVKVRDPIPHKPTTSTVNATRTKHGTKTTYCSVCGKISSIETLHFFEALNSTQYQCTVAGCNEMRSK